MQQSFVERLHQDIKHPSCATCGVPMWLVRIEPSEVNLDQRTFECKACAKIKTEIVKYQ